MNNIKTYILSLLVMMLGSMSAMADNVVTISGFDMAQNETKELSVVLTNTDPVSVLQLEFTLPYGVKVVDSDANGKINANDFNKVGRSLRHGLTVTQKTVNDSKNRECEAYQLIVSSTSLREMAAGEDAIVSFSVKSSSDFVPFNKITVNNVKANNKTTTSDNFVVTAPDIANGKANFTLSADPVSALVGETKTVSLNLNNPLKISQMSAKIILPEGLEIVPDEEGYLYMPTTRTGNHEVDGKALGNNEYTLLISSNSDSEMKGTDGAIVTFVVKGTKVIENGNITIKDVTCSDTYSTSVDVNDITVPVNIKSAYDPEDTNKDGKIDIADVQYVLNYIGEEYNSQADANQDGKVDIADVQAVLNKM